MSLSYTHLCESQAIRRRTESHLKNFPEDANAVKNDINHVFKFHVGDKVKKRWDWSKEKKNRFAPDWASMRPGVIMKIYPDVYKLSCSGSISIGNR